MAQYRSQLLTGAQGRVLEVDAGTGLNLPYYGTGATDLVFADPVPPLVERSSGARAPADGRAAW